VGQAGRRGTFEERKAESIAKREERNRVDREAWLQRQAERDVILDRDYTPPRGTEPRQLSVGTGGFGGRGRSSKMMLMAALLAATASSIHPQALSDIRRV